ncbi:hypothetical protein ACFX5E_00155 [Flavobacterium sp. LS2P90]|uniref:Uncharacterized protein n=1 Tax=Flavobacterium xylosi TaxID=3230415 RepID=A0ABW6HSA6_9FLAO
MTDLEYLELKSNKEILAELFRSLISYAGVNRLLPEEEFNKELQKTLQFEHSDNSFLLESCADLIEDTDYAIQEFLKNGLQTNPNSQGELYLRLYGILNAIYLQINTIIELVEIFKIPNKKEIVSKFKDLNIYKLRNMVGSHTVNYTIDNSKKSNKDNTDFFRVAQTSIDKWSTNLLVVSQKTECYNFDLKHSVLDYIEVSDKVLLDICNKVEPKLFPKRKDLNEWMMFRLVHVRNKIN